MEQIKPTYKISIGLIIIIYLGLIISLTINKVPVQDHIALTGVFVALFTGVLAISISDKRPCNIEFDLKVFGNNTKGKSDYNLSNLSEEIRPHFSNFGDNFSSYKVNFKITNTSNFVLKKPTVTIKIPTKVKHPSKDMNNLEVRSNMFNSPLSLQSLEYGETQILSNSNLPFLHPGESMKIWIRMTLDKEDTNKLIFHISLDSENAEGIVVKKSMTPKEILDEKE